MWRVCETLNESAYPNAFNSLGSAYAHCVMLPAPWDTTRSPGFARPSTIPASSGACTLIYHLAVAMGAQAGDAKWAVDARRSAARRPA